ncbi:MAG: Twin-arginine translocation protein TatC, partial [uncultured Thermomicrobiales bacterium]
GPSVPRPPLPRTGQAPRFSRPPPARPERARRLRGDDARGAPRRTQAAPDPDGSGDRRWPHHRLSVRPAAAQDHRREREQRRGAGRPESDRQPDGRLQGRPLHRHRHHVPGPPLSGHRLPRPRSHQPREADRLHLAPVRGAALHRRSLVLVLLRDPPGAAVPLQLRGRHLPGRCRRAGDGQLLSDDHGGPRSVVPAAVGDVPAGQDQYRQRGQDAEVAPVLVPDDHRGRRDHHSDHGSHQPRARRPATRDPLRDRHHPGACPGPWRDDARPGADGGL